MKLMNAPILSASNPLIKSAVKLRESSKQRALEKKVFVSGIHNVIEASLHVTPYHLFSLAPQELPEHLLQHTHLVTEAIMRKLCKQPSCPKHCGLFALPSPSPLNTSHTLILDGLQDPGNLGTLIRSMKAFSWNHLCLLENSVDIFNDKCIRSAKAYNFSISYSQKSWHEVENFAKNNSIPILMANLKGKPPESFSFHNSPCYLVLGSEGAGIQLPNASFHNHVSLEMDKSVESLNVGVSGSLLMYILSKGK